MKAAIFAVWCVFGLAIVPNILASHPHYVNMLGFWLLFAVTLTLALGLWLWPQKWFEDRE